MPGLLALVLAGTVGTTLAARAGAAPAASAAEGPGLLALVRPGTVGATLAARADAAPAASAADAATTNVYLAPSAAGGSDSNTGLSSSSPILTLARAQQVLQQAAPAGRGQVLIGPGT